MAPLQDFSSVASSGRLQYKTICVVHYIRICRLGYYLYLPLSVVRDAPFFFPFRGWSRSNVNAQRCSSAAELWGPKLLVEISSMWQAISCTNDHRNWGAHHRFFGQLHFPGSTGGGLTDMLEASLRPYFNRIGCCPLDGGYTSSKYTTIPTSTDCTPAIRASTDCSTIIHEGSHCAPAIRARTDYQITNHRIILDDSTIYTSLTNSTVGDRRRRPCRL